jgi:hypothetical protein
MSATHRKNFCMNSIASQYEEAMLIVAKTKLYIKKVSPDCNG